MKVQRNAIFRLWCVGICTGLGTHDHKVFDDQQEANDYAHSIKKLFHRVVVWEMTKEGKR